MTHDLPRASWTKPFRLKGDTTMQPGVEPVFREKEQALDYAQNRACFRSGEVRIFDSRDNVERVIPFSEAHQKL